VDLQAGGVIAPTLESHLDGLRLAGVVEDCYDQARHGSLKQVGVIAGQDGAVTDL
jgi:hypothetical protein